MQYSSSFSNSVQISGSFEQRQSTAIPCVAASSRLSETSETTVDLASSQRAAISKAYGDILLSGGHFSC